ncbi:DUF1016 N-terminal domain-containing protein [Methanomicrobium antiquum]|uniref:DUF1016 N-terminal domain-containing protein n=1 Tax=Methanomicrobium antiquum TaxID=487686 RepID=A0AAF0FQ44_9EURY|nr:DUF1016 N-terminal domain-containing protein [Methanomicrobium antiquum]WFN36467.1 DUF1016 N-terminal domain-containing protein [Methanomicrobium antiquum]
MQRLSEDLQMEFPGIKGFSAQNLWYMRQFYREYCDDENLQPLVGEISWSHNLVIMSRCKESPKREFLSKWSGNSGGQEMSLFTR